VRRFIDWRLSAGISSNSKDSFRQGCFWTLQSLQWQGFDIVVCSCFAQSEDPTGSTWGAVSAVFGGWGLRRAHYLCYEGRAWLCSFRYTMYSLVCSSVRLPAKFNLDVFGWVLPASLAKILIPWEKTRASSTPQGPFQGFF